MKRMMAPTTALDTISKIRMVLTAWVMVMRIVSWAVFSVQMSFERFRTGQVDLLFFNIVPFLVSKHESEDRNSRSCLEV